MDSVNYDALFGPWMVVSRKWNDNKGVKKKKISFLTGSGKDLHHGKPKEPLENPSCNKFWAGLNEINELDGERKANWN